MPKREEHLKLREIRHISFKRIIWQSPALKLRLCNMDREHFIVTVPGKRRKQKRTSLRRRTLTSEMCEQKKSGKSRKWIEWATTEACIICGQPKFAHAAPKVSPRVIKGALPKHQKARIGAGPCVRAALGRLRLHSPPHAAPAASDAQTHAFCEWCCGWERISGLPEGGTAAPWLWLDVWSDVTLSAASMPLVFSRARSARG